MSPSDNIFVLTIIWCIMDNPYKNRESLEELYIKQGLSTNKIAKIAGVSNRTISSWLKKFDIPVRDTSDAMKLMSKEISARSKKYWQDQKYKDNITEKVNKRYANKQERDKSRQHSIGYWKDQKSKELASKISKSHWKDPNFRSKNIRSVKKSWTKQKKSKQSKEAKKLWENNEYRQKTVAAINKVTGTDKWREEQSARTIITWQKDDYREKISSAMREKHKDKQYKIKLAQARNHQPTSSRLEEVIHSILDEYNVRYEKHKLIKFYEFDLLVYRHDMKPILIEINGDYWHKDRPLDRSKKTYCDRYLSDSHDFLVICEHEFCAEYNIFDILVQKSIIDAKIINVQIKELEFKQVGRVEYNKFYQKYHYIGNAGKWGYTVGAYYKGRLVAAVTYSGCSRKESAERLKIRPNQMRELSRLCRHPKYKCRNLLSKLISRSIQMLKNDRPGVTHLITFADTTRGHTGSIYKAANWVEDGFTSPSYHYVKNGHVAYKKTVWDNAKKMGYTESEYAQKYGFVKVREDKKIRFVYKLYD